MCLSYHLSLLLNLVKKAREEKSGFPSLYAATFLGFFASKLSAQVLLENGDTLTHLFLQ